MFRRRNFLSLILNAIAVLPFMEAASVAGMFLKDNPQQKIEEGPSVDVESQKQWIKVTIHEEGKEPITHTWEYAFLKHGDPPEVGYMGKSKGAEDNG